jgi:hypothetical protein
LNAINLSDLISLSLWERARVREKIVYFSNPFDPHPSLPSLLRRGRGWFN